jgi:hypothetical protein
MDGRGRGHTLGARPPIHCQDWRCLARGTLMPARRSYRSTACIATVALNAAADSSSLEPLSRLKEERNARSPRACAPRSASRRSPGSRKATGCWSDHCRQSPSQRRATKPQDRCETPLRPCRPTTLDRVTQGRREVQFALTYHSCRLCHQSRHRRSRSFRIRHLARSVPGPDRSARWAR